MERTLYNGFLSGLALDGGGYSYVNPLHVRDDHRDAVERGARRLPWYACACCPPNVMRTLASLQHYLATTDASGVQLHHYASGEVGPLRVATDYPWDGRVEIEVAEAGEWTLSLRVPSWAEGATVDGEPAPAGEYARVERSWRPGDTVTLELPLAARLTAPHPRIDAVRGCLAIERGPLVYCIEGADAPAGAPLDDLRLDPRAPLSDVRRSDLLGGIVAVEGTGAEVRPDWDPDWAYAPIRASGEGTARATGEGTAWAMGEGTARASREGTAGATREGTAGATREGTAGATREGTAGATRDGAGGEVPLVAVPYALWGNRGDGPMRVWIPTAG
jgi:DUF1680 family protein